MKVIALVLALGFGALAQQRDAAVVAPTGTGAISGVVMSADATPRPIRRAVVTITGDLPAARSVVTDDAGRFSFTRLPDGTFTVRVKKASYLPGAYGAAKPNRPAMPIALAKGQRLAINIVLFKGAVIAGALRNAVGAPVAGVTVSAFETRSVEAAGTNQGQSPETTTTDDRGVFRIFGLAPGEYVVAATAQPGGDGEIGARSAAEMDALLSTLTQRQNRAATTGAGAPPPPALPPSSSYGYAPTFFPGTAFYSEAARIRVAAGEERESVHFELTHVRVATIEGVVSGNVPSLQTVQLAIIPSNGPRVTGVLGTAGITAQPPNERGEFKYGNLPPGRYRIVARARGGPADPNTPPTLAGVTQVGGRGGAAPPGTILTATGDMLYAVADVDVRGQDVGGVSLQLQLGGSFSGKVVFDAGAAPVPADLTAIRVALSTIGGSYLASSGNVRVGNAINSIQPVNIGSDGTFFINGIGPDTYFVNCQMPANLSSVWKLRSAVIDGRELLDSNIEGPHVQLKNVVVTLSDKPTEISGTLQSASGQPATDYYVVLFSTDAAMWRVGSRRSKSARPATDGKFAFTDLPAGEYFMAALTDLDPLDWQTKEFLEQVVPSGVKVTVAEGERKVQDLRIK